MGKGETTVIRNYVPITRPFVGGFPQEPLFFLTLFSIQKVSSFITFNSSASSRGLTCVSCICCHPGNSVSWKGSAASEDQLAEGEFEQGNSIGEQRECTS